MFINIINYRKFLENEILMNTEGLLYYESLDLDINFKLYGWIPFINYKLEINV